MIMCYIMLIMHAYIAVVVQTRKRENKIIIYRYIYMTNLFQRHRSSVTIPVSLCSFLRRSLTFFRYVFFLSLLFIRARWFVHLSMFASAYPRKIIRTLHVIRNLCHRGAFGKYLSSMPVSARHLWPHNFFFRL